MMYQFNRNIVLYVFSAYIAFYQMPALALDWTIRPSASLEQVYSDNIRLSDTNKKSALVTEVRPGVSINGQSSRSTVDLNYNLQGLYNARGDSGVDINNQLQMNTDYEFVRDKLFIESSASVSQQNNSNRRIVIDNISGGDSSSDISTFKISPYWTPHFKGFADGMFRVTYDRVSAEGNDRLSNTDAVSQNISLTSGNDFSLLSWSLLFNNSDRQNSNGDDVSFQNSQLELRHALGREFNVFARGGQSSNSFASNSNSNSNGISYTFGGQWKPSQRFSLEAGYGNNRFVTVVISPFNRLHWTATYSDNDIGLNTGSRWNTVLDYTTRRSVWKLSYSEDTMTTQQLLLDQQIFTTSDAFGNSIQGTSNDALRNSTLPTLTDEVFVTKRADISFSFKTGKSDISANAFKTFRTFEQSSNDQEVTGLSTSWNWQFLKRTSSNLRASWQKTESDGINSFSDERFDFSASVTRNILARLNGSLEYRFVDQSSNDNLNSYSENRITANLSLQF